MQHGMERKSVPEQQQEIVRAPWRKKQTKDWFVHQDLCYKEIFVVLRQHRHHRDVITNKSRSVPPRHRPVKLLAPD